MRAPGIVITSCAASPAAAHHEIVVAATSAGMLPTLALMAAGVAVALRRWRARWRGDNPAARQGDDR